MSEAGDPTSQSPLRRVSAVVVAYGEVPLIGKCVDAIVASRDVSVDVIVVDNGCPDGALDALVDRPQVQLIGSGQNLGFAGGCNLGAEAATAPVVAFINPDAVVDAPALAALARVLDDPDVGIASARVRLLEEPDLLNSAGGSLHFLGLGWADGFRQPAELHGRQQPVTNASGAAMAMRTQLFDELGGFSDEFFLYHEDCDLSVRVWLSAKRVEFVPAADVWHDYHFSRNAQKFYFLERNRLIIVLSMYRVRTLLLLAPALVMLEFGMVLLAAKQGWLADKVRGWRWIVSNRRWVAEHRRRMQDGRVLADRDLVPLLSGRFDAGQLAMPSALRPVDWMFGQYWRLLSRLV